MTRLDPGEWAALAIAAAACVFDLRWRRIPNLLTFGGAAAGLAYALAMHGAAGLISSGGGWLAGAALFLPFFLLRGMGAGDVKLLACIGAWLGPGPVVWVALYTAIAGGVLAVAVALAAGYLRRALTNVSLMVLYWRVSGLRPVPEVTLAGSRGPRLPYAIPIAAGTALALWLR
jgi:prepilin peptidase CpaA